MRNRLWSTITITGVLIVVAGCGGVASTPAPAPATGAPSAAPPSAAASEAPSEAPPSEAPPSEEAPSEAAAFPLTVTDGDGVSHTFDAPVTKVACLNGACIEVLADLGLAPWAAYTDPAPDSAFNFPAGPAANWVDDFDVEKWAATEPEIFVNWGYAATDMAPLADVGEVVVMHAPYVQWASTPDKVVEPGIEAFKKDLELLGAITGRTEEAQAAIARYDNWVANLAAVAPPEAADVEFANLFHTDDGSYSLHDPASLFCTALTDNAFGRCLEPAGFDAETWEVNAEAFLAADPTAIGYTTYGSDVGYTNRSDPVWNRLTAVEDGKVFDFSDMAYCCSLRGQELALQDYAANVFGEAAGIPDPGEDLDFDPTTSPLAAAP